jgi:hypothetical protein
VICLGTIAPSSSLEVACFNYQPVFS